MAHVSIPVYKGMKMKALKDAIRSELRQGAVAGSNEIANALSTDMVQDEKFADKVTKAAYAAINKMKPAVKGTRTLFKDLEESTDDDDMCESVYAYFVFVQQ